MPEFREVARLESENEGYVGVAGRDFPLIDVRGESIMMRGRGARSSSMGYDGKTAECNASKPRDDSRVFDYRWFGLVGGV